MREGLRIIAISSPVKLPDESARIAHLLRGNDWIDWFHLRKPEWEKKDIKNLLKGIPENFYPKIKLHDHFELLNEFPLGGVHLNSRNPQCSFRVNSLSRSVHSLAELEYFDGLDYVTLSPIFDSISKEGYKSAFDLYSLKDILKSKKVVALGGVTLSHLPILKETGFWGAAMLGYFWNQSSPQNG